MNVAVQGPVAGGGVVRLLVVDGMMKSFTSASDFKAKFGDQPASILYVTGGTLLSPQRRYFVVKY